MFLQQSFWLVFSKFFVVGGFGFGVDMFSTYVFKDRLKLHKYLSNSLGFIIGMLFRYVINRIWTFQSDDPQIMEQFLKFSLIGLVGLGIVNFFLWIFNDRLNIKFYWAKVLAMLFFFAWNFTANYFWTFSMG
jgi:putative flippase GtrA